MARGAGLSAKSGGMGIRTPDIQLAKLALYQLSYTPRGADSSAEVASAGDGEKFAGGEWVKTMLCTAALVDVFYKAHW